MPRVSVKTILDVKTGREAGRRLRRRAGTGAPTSVAPKNTVLTNIARTITVPKSVIRTSATPTTRERETTHFRLR